MPDEFAVPETGQPIAASPADTAAPKKNNKGLVLALGALAILVVVGAIAAVLVLFVFQTSTDNVVEVRVPEGQTSQQGGSTAATETVEAASPAAAVANSEIFTFRDIFEPLVGAVSAPTSPTETTTDTAVPGDYAADTLYLIAIGSESGVSYADMVWNSQAYTLAEGDVIPDTPWKVFDIRTSDVVMLYGDQQVVLSVGQGISK
ncbi:MAG: hypothetical protein CVT59_02050 [Actinobacteria bacterium HGW-Actinobacteria-1]|nr:MAG: hypothetical protein CVT59_02050 [Actinobacteria bacterium HGW-Actinobacteria-1]